MWKELVMKVTIPYLMQHGLPPMGLKPMTENEARQLSNEMCDDCMLLLYDAIENGVMDDGHSWMVMYTEFNTITHTEPTGLLCKHCIGFKQLIHDSVIVAIPVAEPNKANGGNVEYVENGVCASDTNPCDLGEVIDSGVVPTGVHGSFHIYDQDLSMSGIHIQEGVAYLPGIAHMYSRAIPSESQLPELCPFCVKEISQECKCKCQCEEES